MPDQSHAFGGGAIETNIGPVWLVLMIITIVLILVLPRNYVLIPVLLCSFLTPTGQQLYIGGIHWFVYRIIVLVGCLRMIVFRLTAKEGALAGGFNPVDGAFLGCIVFQAMGVMLQFKQSQAVINQFGFLIDFLGAYFLLRALIREEADIYRALKCVAVFTVIVAAGMIREQMTLQNIFGTLGGVKLIPDLREGRIRSQGVFQHSITAGTFAATLPPLFILLWKNGKSRILAVLGIAGSIIMTICSYSSTPLLVIVSGLVAVLLWPLRKEMRVVRWGIVIAICALAAVMKAPVWFVIAHIDLTGGSSGYHRAELIDQFLRHFSDWWLYGTNESGKWAYDMWDQQNQYVAIGEAGGLAAITLFIVLISKTIARLGNARKLVDGDKATEWLLWLLGASLFANIVGFFGANYFDQSKVVWFMLLAMIMAVTAPILAGKTSEVTVPAGGQFRIPRLAYSAPAGIGQSGKQTPRMLLKKE
jgi:hypothetical protein